MGARLRGSTETPLLEWEISLKWWRSWSWFGGPQACDEGRAVGFSDSRTSGATGSCGRAENGIESQPALPTKLPGMILYPTLVLYKI